MRLRLLALVLAMYCAACTNTLNQVVSDPTRLPDAVARDHYRLPENILRFSGINQNDRIVEIAPAGGYYTALLSRSIGPGGKVFAVDPARIFEAFPQGREGFPNYITDDPRTNVEYSIQNLDEINVPGPVNQVWMVLYYHDTIWTGEDRAAMNKAFFDALVPGGSYLVIDHHAQAGAPDTVMKDLHRVDAELVRREIEAAGFVLHSTTDVLANPDDPKDDSVFAEHRRGKTDRFVWRYVKP